MACYVKPALHLLSIPGYLDDGETWASIIRHLARAMTLLDWGLMVVGAVCVAMVFLPEKQKTAIEEKSPQETGPPDDPGYEVLSYWGESGNPLRDEMIRDLLGRAHKRYPRMILIKKTGQVKEIPYPPVENRIPRSPWPPSE